MAYPTDSAKGSGVLLQYNHLSTSEVLQQLNSAPRKNPVLQKSLALRRLNSLGSADKTHYSELKHIIFQLNEELERKDKALSYAYNILSRAQREQALLKERNRIASDLHDSVLQLLFCAGIQLETGLRQMDQKSPLYERLCSIENIITNSAEEIRQTIYRLSTEEPCQSLVKSVETLISHLNRGELACIELQVFGKETPLPKNLYRTAYRLVQESLINALKHAMATEIKVCMTFKEEEFSLSIADNGVGISPGGSTENEGGRRKKHFGLSNMLKRVEGAGGNLVIQNAALGRGTEIRAVIQLREA